MRATVLTETLVYDDDGRWTVSLPQQDIACVRVENGDAVTLLIVDRALLERGGVVRVGG